MDRSVEMCLDQGKTRCLKTGRRLRKEFCLSPILLNL